MIGVLDLGHRGLVATALQAGGEPHESISLDHTFEALAALVIETEEVDETVRALVRRASAPGLPVLVVARERAVATAVDLLREGATDYLIAPFDYASLRAAVDRLGATGGGEPGRGELVTRDPEVLATLSLVRSVASSSATVLIQGESGTGKELLAQALHAASPRHTRDLISLNCAALPPGLLESELFGHEKGAFTGAWQRVVGKFELAHGTTILLDEIGELELGLQAKLLRVLQEKQVQRVGARAPVDVDFRLVATTNRDLADEVEQGRFRRDLFYRLHVLPIALKPLRERSGDVPLLIEHFIARHATADGPPQLTPAAMAALEAHDWPGNVRELENLVERLVLTHPGRTVESRDLALTESTRSSAPAALEDVPFRTIREMERWLIVRTLVELKGNRTQTARALGISLRTLRNKIHEYEIRDPDTLPRTGIGRRADGGGQISPGTA